MPHSFFARSALVLFYLEVPGVLGGSASKAAEVALSAPRPTAPTVIQVDAADLRTARVGVIAVQFPQGLVANIQIAIS